MPFQIIHGKTERKWRPQAQRLGRFAAIGVGAELHVVHILIEYTRRKATAADIDSRHPVRCPGNSDVIRAAYPDALAVLHEETDSQPAKMTPHLILDTNRERLVLSQAGSHRSTVILHPRSAKDEAELLRAWRRVTSPTHLAAFSAEFFQVLCDHLVDRSVANQAAVVDQNRARTKNAHSRQVVANEKDSAAIRAGNLAHFSKAFFLKLRVPDSQYF